MSILATIPHAVPSLPIGLMPIAASPIAPVGAGEPFGFCDVITDLETPLQPTSPPTLPAIAASLPAPATIVPALPASGISLPAPAPTVADDAPREIDVADVMVGAQPPVVRPGIAPAPPILPKPIISTMPAPVGSDTALTGAGPDIHPLAVPATKAAPAHAVRPPWVLGTSSALSVARALPLPAKGERVALPEKLPKGGTPTTNEATAPKEPAAPPPIALITPAPVVADAAVKSEVPAPPPATAFAPATWTPQRSEAAKRDKAGSAAAVPVVLFPTTARPIAQMPPADRNAVRPDMPVTASPIAIEPNMAMPDRPIPIPIVANPIAQLPAAEGAVPVDKPVTASPIAPIEPGTARPGPQVPTPITAKPIEPLPAQLPPELTRQIAQLLPPHTREPVEPPALTPAEPTIFPISAPTPAPITVSMPQPVFASQPAPVDTGRSAWMDAMIERIAEMPQVDGKREAVIRLLPDQLGAVEVTVTERGDRLHVVMNADSAQARQMLSEAAPRLHELAEARGLRFAQTDVGGGQQQDRRPAAEQQPQGPNRARPAAAGTDEETPSDGDLIA